MAKDLFDAVYGCLIGGAVGDALGAPVEGWYYKEIKEKFGRLEKFLPFNNEYSYGAPGSITDDSTLRHYMCLAIIEKGGRITPDDFGRIWLEKVNPKRMWANETLIYERLKWGVSAWDSGRGCIPAGCASMAIAPIGIINAGDPEQAYLDGMNIAAVNQDGSNRDFAATFAAAVAKAFVPGAAVEDIIDTMMTYSTDFVKRAMILTMDIAYASSSVEEFTERFYGRMLDWSWTLPPGQWKKDRFFSGNSHEFVPVVPAILYLCKGDVNESIIEGANFGRDCDTISSLCGNIAGAMQGASMIRREWIHECEEINGEFFEEVEGDRKANFYITASRLVEALKMEKKRTEDKLARLNSLIG